MDNAMTSDDMKACRFVLNLEKKKKRNKNTALARIRTQNLRQKEMYFQLCTITSRRLIL